MGVFIWWLFAGRGVFGVSFFPPELLLWLSVFSVDVHFWVYLSGTQWADASEHC